MDSAKTLTVSCHEVSVIKDTFYFGEKAFSVTAVHYTHTDWVSVNYLKNYIMKDHLGFVYFFVHFTDNCTIEGLQGMCCIENVVMKNCKLINTTLAFEYSTVDAQISGKIDSVLNPSGGIMRADYIEEQTVEKDKVDPAKTCIICKRSGKEMEIACALRIWCNIQGDRNENGGKKRM